MDKKAAHSGIVINSLKVERKFRARRTNVVLFLRADDACCGNPLWLDNEGDLLPFDEVPRLIDSDRFKRDSFGVFGNDLKKVVCLLIGGAIAFGVKSLAASPLT